MRHTWLSYQKRDACLGLDADASRYDDDRLVAGAASYAVAGLTGHEIALTTRRLGSARTP